MQGLGFRVSRSGIRRFTQSLGDAWPLNPMKTTQACNALKTAKPEGDRCGTSPFKTGT